MASKYPAKEKVVRSIEGIIVPQAMPKTTVKPVWYTAWRRLNKRIIWIGSGAAIGAGVVTVMLTLALRGNDSLPTAIVKHAGFPLYYPSHTLLNYRYKEGSANTESGIVTYRLDNGSNIITVSEQAVPSDPPILSRLAGFTSLSTDAGNAVVGTAATKQPVAIIVSNTTLITITGQVNMPSDTVAKLAQAMSSLQ